MKIANGLRGTTQSETRGEAEMTIAEDKAALRKEAHRRRAEAAEASPDAGTAFRDRFIESIELLPFVTLSAYWPMGAELDVRPAMEALNRNGHKVLLPVVQSPGKPLLFRLWEPGQELRAAGFGTSEPPPEADLAVPELLIVPLLAFDRDGYRLGYGGGFYDRTLSELKALAPVTAVGAAFAAQEVAAVPHEATDVALDWIVTEREAIRIAG